MNEIKEALLLIGSPKGLSSTSAVLGKYILNNLKENKINTDILHIHSAIKSLSSQKEFINKIKKTDLILLTFPLYVDTLPAAVIKIFKLMSEKIYIEKLNPKQRLIAIANCGFPEAKHNQYALSICQEFAAEKNIKWLGGLSLGMGGAINGKNLNELGNMSNNIKKSLDLVIKSIIQDNIISQQAIDCMETPIISHKRVYTFLASISWLRNAFNNNVFTKLNNKPYL